MWKFDGSTRPDFAETPGPGQESVWDYPRPPALDTSSEEIEVRSGDILLARTDSALRVLETASPPTWYLPPESVQWNTLVRIAGASFCEWKGEASYWALADDPDAKAVGWSYAEPSARFANLAGYISFYPGRVACFVDGERVRPQPGQFYGGWVTDRIVGPVKGEPGTGHW